MEYVCDGIMVKPAGDRLVGLGCCVHFQEQRAHVHLVFHARQCSSILLISILSSPTEIHCAVPASLPGPCLSGRRRVGLDGRWA